MATNASESSPSIVGLPVKTSANCTSIDHPQLIVPIAKPSVGAAPQAFDEDGGMKDDKQRQRVEGIGARLAVVVGKMAGQAK